MAKDLVMKQLVIGYEDESISSPIDLAIPAGSQLALLGPSGCGKSTLLNTIVGGLKVVAGEIWLGEKLMNDVPTHLRGVGIVFQQPLLFPHLNVFENVAFGLRQLGWEKSSIQARVEELLELVKLPSYKERSVTELSGGQAQRISLVRALAPEPAVLLLDEPLAALDAELRIELADELQNILVDKAMTALFVTHDRAEATRVADQIVDWHWD